MKKQSVSLPTCTTNSEFIGSLIAACRPWADLSELTKLQKISELSRPSLVLLINSTLTAGMKLTPGLISGNDGDIIQLFVTHCQRWQGRLKVTLYHQKVLKTRELISLREKIYAQTNPVH